MTGFYPDVPGARMAIDRDGTLGFTINSAGGAITAVTLAQMQQLNNDSGSDGPSVPANGFLALIFPELRDIVGVFRASNAASTIANVEISVNTTNGYDGIWNSLASAGGSLQVETFYRTAIATLVANGVKAIRIRSTSAVGNAVWAFHVYGHPSASGDRLELWHPTLDQPLRQTPAWLDFGDKPRSTSTDVEFRIKNLSAALTAGSITVGMQALTDSTTPTHVSEKTFNYNGGAFAATASLSSLAPGAISQKFVIRNAPGATSVLGLWSQRIYADAASWT